MRLMLLWIVITDTTGLWLVTYFQSGLPLWAAILWALPLLGVLCLVIETMAARQRLLGSALMELKTLAHFFMVHVLALRLLWVSNESEHTFLLQNRESHWRRANGA